MRTSFPRYCGATAAPSVRGGFVLIELICVLAIVAILALVAVPSYNAAGNKARRSEGKILLQTVLAAEENFYATYNRYSSEAGTSGIRVGVVSEPQGYYRLASLTLSSDGQSVAATAEPQNRQAEDPCGILGLDSVGRRTAAGQDCW